MILVHGFTGFSDHGPVGAYFQGVRERYEARGVAVYTPALPPYEHSVVRARFLARAIDEALRETGADRVHLIGHSQGGIDARYVISPRGLGYADRVASVVTISTPHHGTPLVELAGAMPGLVSDPLFEVAQFVIGAPPGVDLGEPRIQGTIDTVSLEAMARFNEEHPDPPEVPLFSVATLSGARDDDVCARGLWPLEGYDAPSFGMLSMWLFLRGKGAASDGMVPTRSMVRGTFLGCVASDHIDVLGLGLELENDDAPAFDHLALYERILDVIAQVDRRDQPSLSHASASSDAVRASPLR